MRLGIRMPVRPLLRSHRPDPALMVRQLVAWRIDDDSLPFGVPPTKPPTWAYSVPSWPPAFDV